jgi:hypothetical protein
MLFDLMHCRVHLRIELGLATPFAGGGALSATTMFWLATLCGQAEMAAIEAVSVATAIASEYAMRRPDRTIAVFAMACAPS